MIAWSYWLLFLLPIGNMVALQHARSRTVSDWMWALTGIVLIVMVGLRHHVGGDWLQYQRFVEIAAQQSLWDALNIIDPAYALVNWLSAQLMGSAHLANFVCAAFAVVPLLYFCRSRSNPWLSLLVAVPYLIIVVYMGYTRQSAAIGICILAIMAIERDRLWAAAALAMIAGLFHNTAAGFLVPIIVLALLPINLAALRQAAALAVVAGLYFWLLFLGWDSLYLIADGAAPMETLLEPGILQPQIEAKLNAYVASEPAVSSSGALARLGLSVLAGLGFLWIQRKKPLLSPPHAIWTLCALGSFALFPAAFVISTFADRIGLYLIPLQLHAVSVADAALTNRHHRALFRLAVIGLSGTILFVWLNYSPHAQGWLPYDNLILHLF